MITQQIRIAIKKTLGEWGFRKFVDDGERGRYERLDETDDEAFCDEVILKMKQLDESLKKSIEGFTN